MAGLSNSRRPFVKFRLPGDKSETRIYLLSEMSRREMIAARRHIEELLRAQQDPEPTPPHESTRDWLEKIPEKLHRRLAAKGLVEAREETKARTLEGFLEVCLSQRRVKDSSKTVYSNAVTNLVTHFGKRRDLSTITPLAVDKFRRWLESSANRVKKGTGLAPATVGKRLKTCREFFDVAVDYGWIKRNPFSHLKHLEQDDHGPPEREVYVDKRTILLLIHDSPDTEWSLILALWRFAGLRQLEPLSLTWDHIAWSENRMTVIAPKQRSERKRSRVIPIWPEVRPWLEKQFDEAPFGSTWVINRHRYAFDTDPAARSAGSGLYGKLQRHLIKSGIIPWPKLCQNLRASGETDRCREGFEDWEVAYWWNHDVKVQKRHYLMVTDEAFRKASAGSPAELGLEKVNHESEPRFFEPGQISKDQRASF